MIILTMEKVKGLFVIATNSLLPHYPFYHRLLKTHFLYSFRYFVFLIITTYAAFLPLYYYKFFPADSLKKATESFVASLDSFPKDLTIMVKSGHLITNYNRPYFMWMDYNDAKLLLFVVDQNASVEDFQKYKPAALITGNTIVLKDGANSEKYNVASLDDVTATIGKTEIGKFKDTLDDILRSFTIIIPILLVFVLPLSMLVANFGYLMFVSLLVFLIAKHFLQHLTYRKTLQLSFHALTLPLIINFSIGFFFLESTMLPISFLILLIVFTAVAVYESHLKYSSTSA